jgi:thiamine biosynthesis protein ThiS
MVDNDIAIIINGFEERVQAESTIDDLIRQFGEGDVDLIVERNGRFVYPQKYGKIVIEKEDRVEFINPNFGG